MGKWYDEYNKGNYAEAKRMALEGVKNKQPDDMYDYAVFSMTGQYGFEQNVKETERVLLELGEINGNDYSETIGSAYFLYDKNYTMARKYWEQAFRNGNNTVRGNLALVCHESGDYAAAYQYAIEDNTCIGTLVMGLLYENGNYVSKNRTKAYEYYSLAIQRPGLTEELQKTLKDAIARTYIGSSAHLSDTGNYIVKRLTIAVVGTLLILGFFALFSVR